MTTQPPQRDEDPEQTAPQTTGQNDRPKLVPPEDTEFSRDWEPLTKFGDDPARAMEQANERTLTWERVDTHTKLLSVPEAQRVISAIGRFNNFHPKNIGEALELLQKLDPTLRVAVGLESSPVLYVHTTRAEYAVTLLKILSPDELQANTGGGVFPKRISDDFEWMNSWTTPTDGTEVLIRAWWD